MSGCWCEACCARDGSQRPEALLDLDRKRELTRLLTLQALWPNAAGRREFKTELHLKREIEDMYEKVYG